MSRWKYRSVVKGPSHRVLIESVDWTSESVPERIRTARPRFTAIALPADADPNTRFGGIGQQLYHGDDPAECWRAVRKLVPRLLDLMPAGHREFMNKWDNLHESQA